MHIILPFSKDKSKWAIKYFAFFFFTERIEYLAREVGQCLKCVLCEHADLSSDLWQPYKNWEIHTCTSVSWGRDRLIPRTSLTVSFTDTAGQGSVNDCLNK